MADVPTESPREDDSIVAASEAVQEQQIERLADLSDGVGKHAAFLRTVLGEQSYFEIAMIAQAAGDTPLTAETMRFIAERWAA